MKTSSTCADSPGSSLLRVSAPHFVAGAEVSHPALVITRTAPIIAYMTGWNLAAAQAYCHRKGWSWLWLKT